jgi:hypothetical protein
LIKTIEEAESFCGHNVFAHDLKYLDSALKDAGLYKTPVIDTLVWSPLLFPQKPKPHTNSGGKSKPAKKNEEYPEIKVILPKLYLKRDF